MSWSNQLLNSLNSGFCKPAHRSSRATWPPSNMKARAASGLPMHKTLLQGVDKPGHPSTKSRPALGAHVSARDQMRRTENMFPVQAGPGPAGHRHLGEFLTSIFITQTQRYPATQLHFQKALWGYMAIFLAFNDFLMLFHSWATSSFWQGKEISSAHYQNEKCIPKQNQLYLSITFKMP